MKSKLEILEKRFLKEYEIDKRNAAEYAYTIAVVARKQGNKEKAKEYAKKSIEIFNEINIQTLEEVAAINNVIDNVVIPELIHEDVVLFNFKELLN
jgi:tetratricopeptide (TPR) repeat protein